MRLADEIKIRAGGPGSGRHPGGGFVQKVKNLFQGQPTQPKEIDKSLRAVIPWGEFGSPLGGDNGERYYNSAFSAYNKFRLQGRIPNRNTGLNSYSHSIKTRPDGSWVHETVSNSDGELLHKKSGIGAQDLKNSLKQGDQVGYKNFHSMNKRLDSYDK